MKTVNKVVFDISLVLALVTFTGVATAECILNQVTNAQTTGRITSTAGINKLVVPFKENQHKCVVSFDALIQNKWHQGVGTHVFGNGESEGKACAIALKTGKLNLIREMFPEDLQSDGVLVCSDEKRKSRLTGIEGMTPIQNKVFQHKGKHCQWFNETVQENNDFYQYTVIMCEMNINEWVELDRF